jgi:hypothetical protein
MIHKTGSAKVCPALSPTLPLQVEEDFHAPFLVRGYNLLIMF